MSDRALSVPLTPQLESRLQEEVRSGRFKTITEAAAAHLAALTEGTASEPTPDATVLDGIGDGFFELDRQWRITAFNRAAEIFFGRPRADVLGRELWEAMPAFVGSSFEVRYRRAMLERRPDAFVSASVIRKGAWVDVRAFPTPIGLGISFRDVTETRRTEEALRTNEERLRFALDAAGLGDWTWDHESDLVVFSPSAAEMFGLDARTVTWRELTETRLHPADVDETRAAVLRALATRDRYRAEYRIRLPSGTWRWVAAFGRAVYDDAGQPRGMQGVVQDISARRFAEFRLKESEARLEIATRTHRIGIFDWNVQTGAVVWSAEEERLFGLRPGTFAGTIDDWEQRVEPVDLAALTERMAQAMERRESATDFQFRIHLPDGAVRHLEGSGRFLYDREGRPERMIGVNIDVTDRVRQIEDLERAERHMRLLVDELNHRVKNTLATVQSIAFQTLRGTGSPEARAEAFTARLLALSRAHDILTRENWEGAALRDVAEAVLEPYLGGWPPRVVIAGPDLRLPPRLALSLAMAIHELATNAVKYGSLSTEAGRVSVAWTVEDKDGGRTDLDFSWTESDGPPVVPPAGRGFGSRLIERGLVLELDGRAELDFRPSGLVCRVSAPLPRSGAEAGSPRLPG